MTSRFAIIEIHEGFNNEKPWMPWRILELYRCFDGVRTRICANAYATHEEALGALKEYRDDVEAEATAKFMNSVTGNNQ